MAAPAVPLPRTASARSASRERTRGRLLAVARRAFARKGLAGTNLKDDVLLPARVSVGSFYHQFRDKTDLFLAILESHSETFRTRMRRAHRPDDPGEPGDLARQSFETVFRIADESDDLFRIMTREHDCEDSRVRAYLRENRRRWTESLADDYRALGLSGVGGDAALVLAAELASAMTMGAVLSYLDRPARERPATRARLIDGLVRFTIGGLPALIAPEAPSLPRPARRGPRPASARKRARST